MFFSANFFCVLSRGNISSGTDSILKPSLNIDNKTAGINLNSNIICSVQQFINIIVRANQNIDRQIISRLEFYWSSGLIAA